MGWRFDPDGGESTRPPLPPRPGSSLTTTQQPSRVVSKLVGTAPKYASSTAHLSARERRPGPHGFRFR
jgi:hypothetical protein